jgi:hypothetical protein
MNKLIYFPGNTQEEKDNLANMLAKSLYRCTGDRKYLKKSYKISY